MKENTEERYNKSVIGKDSGVEHEGNLIPIVLVDNTEVKKISDIIINSNDFLIIHQNLLHINNILDFQDVNIPNELMEHLFTILDKKSNFPDEITSAALQFVYTIFSSNQNPSIFLRPDFVNIVLSYFPCIISCRLLASIYKHKSSILQYLVEVGFIETFVDCIANIKMLEPVSYIIEAINDIVDYIDISRFDIIFEYLVADDDEVKSSALNILKILTSKSIEYSEKIYSNPSFLYIFGSQMDDIMTDTLISLFLNTSVKLNSTFYMDISVINQFLCSYLHSSSCVNDIIDLFYDCMKCPDFIDHFNIQITKVLLEILIQQEHLHFKVLKKVISVVNHIFISKNCIIEPELYISVTRNVLNTSDETMIYDILSVYVMIMLNSPQMLESPEIISDINHGIDVISENPDSSKIIDSLAHIIR